jgi:hypothetical protein
MATLYTEKFPVGSRVRIAHRDFLEDFKRSWKYHHPLVSEQLERAGMLGIVSKVGFYHGGDVLYQLEGIPGTWHEACLQADVSAKKDS